MKPLFVPAEDFTPIEKTAAEWLALRDRGFSAAELRAFENWLAENDQHRDVFDDFEHTWRMMGPATQPKRRVRLANFWPVLAAAAAVAIAYFGWWQPTHRGGHLDIAATEIGSQQVMELPDGSLVRLNTDSAVEVTYTATERRVKLTRGEAHFSVARNPARPFIVAASGVAVRAVGTAFNIRMHAGSVEVLVTEGKVRVDDSNGGQTLLPAGRASDTPVLFAGERAIIPVALVASPVGPPIPAPAPATVPIATIPPEQIERAMAWQEQRLEFVAAPLSEIVADFNRYNRHKLVIADAALAGQRFGGTFRPNEPETLVRQLEMSFGVVSEMRGDRTILRSGEP